MGTSVDPEGFAAQVNYLAAIGRLIVPRAFAFVGRRILFVGYAPFHPEELGGLLPEEVRWYEHGDAPEGFAPDILILGRDGFEKGAIKAALQGAKGSPKVIPQEGFLDELLFGHDWWGGEVGSLEAMAKHHRGLQSAKAIGALAPAGITQPEPKKKAVITKPTIGANRPPVRDGSRSVSPPPSSAFAWPSTEAEETRKPGSNDLDYQQETRLYQLGYRITGRTRSQRWRVLITNAIPELGLRTVANTIASHCRTRKRQKDGRKTYAHAIAEWEYDLARLEREIYRDARHQFPWPKSEP